ncbi:hypothetical protein F5Y08DRAFT_333306 [Xylaria arbuscula]|nr:hypothetical protein F5Y08DRAFT_333306 [Xylaria arbuscula]
MLPASSSNLCTPYLSMLCDRCLVRLHDGHISPEKPTPSASAGTLLPGPMASAVSLFARSTTLALRIGTTVSGYGLGAAKVTTLSSLKLSKVILDEILIRAGHDVFAGSTSDSSRADAESILEASLESMHQAMSRLVFWTAAGFHAAGTAVSATSELSELLLTGLDQLFGSTDSSRAIASIITLIRREFQNPATGVEGESVGLMDLFLGLCGLAYLQNSCRKLIQEESRRLEYDETIWDVIVQDNGERVDAPDDDDFYDANYAQSPVISNANDTVADIDYHGSRRSSTDTEDELIETQLRKHIAKSLPEHATISITTSTTTTKTITVDVTGASDLSIPSFPNLGLVSSEVTDSQLPSRNNQGRASNYRVVYKLSRNRIQKVLEDSPDASKSSFSAVEPATNSHGQSASPTSPSTRKPGVILSRASKTKKPTFSSSIKERINALNKDVSRQTQSLYHGPSGSVNGSPRESSSVNSPRDSNGCAANQKRTRAPLDSPRRDIENLTVQIPTGSPIMAVSKLPKKPDTKSTKRLERKTGIRGVLGKRPAPTSGGLFSRESSSDNISGSKTKSSTKPAWNSHIFSHANASSTGPKSPVSDRTSGVVSNQEPPRTPQRENTKPFISRDFNSIVDSEKHKGPLLSPAFPTGSRRRSSVISLTDTISIHSYDSRPPSPHHHQSEMKTGCNATDQKLGHGPQPAMLSPERLRRPAVPRNHTPSIYTLRTGDSDTSLVISSSLVKSAYGDPMALESLRQCGAASGMFPNFHFLRNITRYSRYASAVYGNKFLTLMGISKDRPIQNIAEEIHYDVRSFAHHAKLPPDSILLASFVDPQGGSDSTGATDTGVPLVHTVALDEESKAVVLTCRGTMGFEDVLADMMCDYDDLTWRGKTYKVHKGIHASARRLLYGADGRVLITIKAALEENPGYGLVLCGHSLGGAVTALLGVMLAEPSTTGAGFFTSAAQQLKLLDNGSPWAPTQICLPSGRPIHVYAYGPPAIMSPSLQKATRGLITSTVHGNDMVPYLSLGVLHDFQALALAFKTDNNEAKAEIKRRVWEGLRSGLADKWYNNPTKQCNEDDEHWGYIALKTLRVSMMSSKLLPPGEVFKVDSTLVMRRDAFTQETIDEVGRPATRIVLKYIRNVEAHFREVRFGASMLTDHSPGRYEDALRRLTLGVVQIS